MRLMAELTTRGAKSFEKFDKLPQNPVFIANYREMAADPMQMVKNIYSHFNIKLTPEAEGKMQKYIDEHPQNKHGRHKYSLEKYGVTLEDVKQALEPYTNYFIKKGFAYEDII